MVVSMKLPLLNKPLLLPITLLTIAITLTVSTAAILNSQSDTLYVPPMGSIQQTEPETNDNPNQTPQNTDANSNQDPTNYNNDTNALNPTNGTNQNPLNTTFAQTNQTTNNNTTSTKPQNKVMSTVNLNLYTDATATKTCENLIWGALAPGEKATKTIYIKNTGNSIATLSMEASEWTPLDATNKLNLTWNRQGANLSPGSTMEATFTLSVSENPDDLTDFNMNIIILGTAQ
jgi:hypothetical protein